MSKISNIKDILRQYKNCRFTNYGSCILEGKFGRILVPIDNIDVVLVRKISGNGKIIINNISHIVRSKTSEEINVSLQGKLEIHRPKDSIGEVEIFGLIVEEDNELKHKWKNIFSKCGSYQCIRMVNNRVHASEGAFIDGSNILSIETNPPNMINKENNLIKFIGSCEITNIVLKGECEVKEGFKQFAHLTPPGPIFTAPKNTPDVQPKIQNNILSDNNAVLSPLITNKEENFMNILYDSDNVKEFTSIKSSSNKNGLAKYLRSNGKDYLVLKRGGSFTIPVVVQPNSEYLLQFTAQKLSGNGKIHIGSYSNNFFQGNLCLVDNVFRTKSVKIKTNSNSPQKIQIKMMEDSVGEILISKICLLTDQLISTHETPILAQPSSVGKKFVIVIPSYKNSKWCERNIESTINQNYQNYRVIFTDDASPDDTFERVSSIVSRSNKAYKFKLIKNNKRIGALHNLYNMIISCDDDEIILTLDGDDWLAHENVLNILNSYYSKEDIWMTYGQYQNYPAPGIGISRQIPENIITNNQYRRYDWCSSHLRTFYTWLFKQIKPEDLKYEGEFMSMAWDMTIMFPMLEMSGRRSKFISDILYTYNLENPINDHKVNVSLQQKLDRYVRNMPIYTPLQSKPRLVTNIGLLLIATGKYDKFVQGIVSSADNYFLKEPDCNVTYFLFSDKEQKIKTNRNLIRLPIEHRKFPFASMDRFRHFTKYAESFRDQDYLYYVDVDCLFVDNVSKEILGNLVGVRHCGFFNKTGPYEKNPKSVFYVDEQYPKKYKYYFGGGFSGGKRDFYLNLARRCSEQIDIDLSNNIIPLWHDETAINRYFLDNEPDVILDPGYHYPQANLKYYKESWAPFVFVPKILLLDKNHGDVRK